MDEDEFEQTADAAIKKLTESHPLATGEQREMIDQLMKPKLQHNPKAPMIVSTGQGRQYVMGRGGADQMWGLDFETYSDVDIKTHGIDRYVSSPHFKVLMACVVGQDGTRKQFDFVLGNSMGSAYAMESFRDFMITGQKIFVAHNAAFERAVLRSLNIWLDDMIVDSAVVARCLGASSALEHAAPQLLPGGQKMPEGKALIKQFSVPHVDDNGEEFAWVDRVADWTDEMHEDWQTFLRYCTIDAHLGLKIWLEWNERIQAKEYDFERLTNSMNFLGWKVDMDLVREMKRRYDENVEMLLKDFYELHDTSRELNFNSPQQLARWCKARGVRVTSLDKDHLPKIRAEIRKEMDRISSIPLAQKTVGQAQKFQRLAGVYDMLTTKHEMAGSSLKKLQTIIDMIGDDDRLRGQYMHCGAGQSHRTSGRGVQLQNVKRLNGDPDDVDELYVDGPWWPNEKLASNLRQVFTAGEPDGELIVADFKAIEARVLAWLADQQWKLNAFTEGKDLYRVMAAEMFNTTYEAIPPKGDERTAGKVGELSCGYGAGPGAVRKFAGKMGVEFTEVQAAQTVNDWRDVNRHIVELWSKLDTLMREVVTSDMTRNSVMLRKRRGDLSALEAVVEVIKSPQSLKIEYPQAKTLRLTLSWADTGTVLLSRVFQGVRMIGRDMCYVKPDESRADKSWKHKWFKDGQSGYYKLYGGKITGILTQSLAREIFMDATAKLHAKFAKTPRVNLIGQFHDELIIEWLKNSEYTLSETIEWIDRYMSGYLLPGLPVEASIGHTYRYTK